MMEYQIFQLIGLYFVYYIGIPGLIGLMIWKIKGKADFIKGLSIFGGEGKDKSSTQLEEENKKFKKLQVLFVVLLLVSMPVLNLTFYGLQDISMHRSRNYMSWETIFPAHVDRVKEKIGPSSDTEGVIERMEDDGNIDWYLDDIREQIDLEELTRFPGRITVYKLRRGRANTEQIVINYAYLSPIPVTRSIEFVVLQEKAFLEADRTVVYPMPPSIAAPS
ncbi:MAG: hypothetical protein V5A88_08965 [Candidatus Thermoplasmatota archaeon]